VSRPIIEVRNLSKRYRLGAIGATSIREQASRIWDRVRGVPHADKQDYWALRDVSFDIQPGEVVGVIGRNGAGKSTLLKILSRITEPTSGTARIRGRVASLLEVGTGFHPELTGRENVYLNGAILGMNRAEVRSKFDEIVAFAEIDQFIDTPVKRYSSGMYVRLAFAVAAHLEPEILIIDEVLAVGDAQFQQKCVGRMRTDANSGRTILFVSHQLNAIAQFCSRCLYLENGRLLEDGKPRNVAQRYFATDATQPPMQDLKSRQRKDANRGKAMLCQLSLPNSPDPSGWRLPFATAPVFELRLDITEQFTSLDVSLCLLDAAGLEVLSVLSCWSGRLGPFSPGQTVIRAACPELNLAPGTYQVHLGVRSPAGVEDYLPSAGSFEILPINDPRWPEAERMSGLVRQQATFTVTT
jgi:lipopolysaccharide transport system ATP-binding protein